ncbi:hypothetical protein EK21DRAFT_85692 [Setomelanomma holmii]|uniref:Uncharacterized protein n=1 Tax=Setomelanomma holmii TaxID=210430 RepID=A0A9P4HHR2_9PLEO|nr:hypothetical protein EK21DRAFT_85692 [Setomelanomma holmii]
MRYCTSRVHTENNFEQSRSHVAGYQATIVRRAGIAKDHGRVSSCRAVPEQCQYIRLVLSGEEHQPNTDIILEIEGTQNNARDVEAIQYHDIRPWNILPSCCQAQGVQKLKYRKTSATSVANVASEQAHLRRPHFACGKQFGTLSQLVPACNCTIDFRHLVEHRSVTSQALRTTCAWDATVAVFNQGTNTCDDLHRLGLGIAHAGHPTIRISKPRVVLWSI